MKTTTSTAEVRADLSRLSYWLLPLGMAAVAVLGCGPAKEAASIADFPSIEKLSPNQQNQKKKAIEAKDQLFASLSSALTKSMEAKGPAASIAVCQQQAPEIAKSVSEQSGVKIGRTSFKLRNSKNNPPKWAQPHVAKKSAEPVHVGLEGNKLGVLLPIKLQAKCALCHGTNQQVSQDVRDAIAKAYPNDKATGFKVGDIRGYFWIEVPELDSSIEE